MRLAICLAGILAAASVGAQETVVIDNKPSCPKCTIDLVKIATVTAFDTFPPPGSAFTRDSKGGFVFQALAKGILYQYSADGKFVRVIGRFGKGPGEFAFPRPAVFSKGDTLVVADNSLKRVSRMTHDGVYIDMTKDIEWIPRLYRDPDGLLIRENQRSRDACFAVISTTGTILKRFADCMGKWPDPPPGLQVEGPTTRPVALTGHQTLWAARQHKYEIEQWTYDNQHVKTLVRNVDWFPPREERESGWEGTGPTARPKPYLADIGSTPDGLLIVNTARPEADWQPPQRDAAGKMVPGQPYRMIVTLDVIDPKTGKLVVSREFHGQRFNDFNEGNLVALQREGDDGAIYMDVFQVVVKRP